MQTSTRYWVNTVSLDHVRLGTAGGFTQAGHGSRSHLERLRPGDGLVFYSPRTALDEGEPLQQFTALGVVTGDRPYQVEMTPDVHPWRTAVRFLPARPAAARPLVGRLSFVPDPERWGLPFRRGLFEVSQPDFVTLAEAMDVTWPVADLEAVLAS